MTAPTATGRNIVICCDGTGNQVERDLSNVTKLYRMCRRDEDQRVFYDPGVGTIGRNSPWRRIRQRAAVVFGLATGAGIDENILDAYRWLASVYQDGDRVFLFGFSRGAYTVRALAGLLHLVGLLSPDQLVFSDSALGAYKRVNEDGGFEQVWDFERVVRPRRVPIHFVGAWDTVASVLVPRRGGLPTQQRLPYTRRNPSVRAFRHAIAIDERRRMFRLNRWTEPQAFGTDDDAPAQDVRQMWFAGVHGDVGGGYPEAESGASKHPLAWMVAEAEAEGLVVDHALRDHLIEGAPLEGGRHAYVPPSATAALHDSATGPWRLLEWLPKRTRWREAGRRSLLGWYLPRYEPRPIPPVADVHPSVRERMRADPSYRPPNVGPPLG